MVVGAAGVYAVGYNFLGLGNNDGNWAVLIAYPVLLGAATLAGMLSMLALWSAAKRGVGVWLVSLILLLAFIVLAHFAAQWDNRSRENEGYARRLEFDNCQSASQTRAQEVSFYGLSELHYLIVLEPNSTEPKELRTTLCGGLADKMSGLQRGQKIIVHTGEYYVVKVEVAP